jgi:hypothetical protein
MANVEELDPDPFIALLNTMGLETKIRQGHISNFEGYSPRVAESIHSTLR